MGDFNDERYVLLKTWTKMSNTLHDGGYREGSSTGRDLTFQQAFDSGYDEGFKMAYKLGIHNGIVRILNSEVSAVDATLKSFLSDIKLPPKEELCAICSEERNPTTCEPNSTISKNDIQVVNVTKFMSSQRKLMGDIENSLLTDKYISLLNQTKLNILFN